MRRVSTPFLTLSALLAVSACSKQEAPPEPAPEAAPQPSAHAAAVEEAPAAAGAKTEEPAEEPAVPAANAQQQPPGEKNCGGDDEPLCPLGQWMDDNTRVAAEEGDLEAMAAAFHKIEFMAPDPSWNEGEDAWNRIARRGAVAAEGGDLRAARKQCKACHQQWRDQYEEDHWFREVPELPPNAAEGDPDLTL